MGINGGETGVAASPPCLVSVPALPAEVEASDCICVCMSATKYSNEKGFLSASKADRVTVWSRHTFWLDFKGAVPRRGSGAFLLDTKLP